MCRAGKYHINASNPLEVALSSQTVAFFSAMAGSNTPGKDWPAFTNATQTAMLFGDASAARSALTTRHEPFNSTSMDVNSILFAPPRVRRTPMARTCGEPS